MTPCSCAQRTVARLSRAQSDVRPEIWTARRAASPSVTGRASIGGGGTTGRGLTVMRTCVRMTPRPWRPAAELEKALERGDLRHAVALAEELRVERGRPIELETAARFLPLIAAASPGEYDAYALRWLGSLGRPRPARPRSRRLPRWRRRWRTCRWSRGCWSRSRGAVGPPGVPSPAPPIVTAMCGRYTNTAGPGRTQRPLPRADRRHRGHAPLQRRTHRRGAGGGAQGRRPARRADALGAGPLMGDRDQGPADDQRADGDGRGEARVPAPAPSRRTPRPAARRRLLRVAQTGAPRRAAASRSISRWTAASRSRSPRCGRPRRCRGSGCTASRCSPATRPPTASPPRSTTACP